MSDQFERVNRAIIDRSIDEFSYAYLQIRVFLKKKKKKERKIHLNFIDRMFVNLNIVLSYLHY